MKITCGRLALVADAQLIKKNKTIMSEINKSESTKGNNALPLVIWRNWVLPFIIGLFASVIFTVAFSYIPKNMITTNFLAGWLSCIVWGIARKYYAI